jgi:hemolysin activation/secretion protein
VAPKGATFVLRAFTFAGNELLSAEELGTALNGYVGRRVTLEDLRNAAAEVSLLYRAKGFVATVSVPRQEVLDGVVRLQVLESRFGEVLVDPASDGRISAELLKRIVRHALPPGAPTDMRRLDRGILLAGDLPGASVTGGLAAGSQEGQSDLVLLSRRTPLAQATFTADNSGSHSTGDWRALATASLASPQGWGEQVSADLLKSQGARYGKVGFALPAGYEGAKVSATLSRMDYELIAGDFVAANLHGHSTSWGLDYTNPLVRSRVFNVYLRAGYESKGFHNEGAGTVTSDYRVGAFSAGFNANFYDGLLGGGVNNAQLMWTYGDLDLAGSPNQASVAATTKAEGHFQKLHLTFSRTQNVATDLTLVASVDGQLASKNLDSSEKLFAGGAAAVRAYPTSEGSGDAGFVASLEARWQFAPRWQAIAFVDHASLRVNQDNAISGAAAVNQVAYHGAGLGVSWVGPADSVWRVVWSRRLGDNPSPKPTGMDQDGTLCLDRVWLSIGATF